MNHHLAQINISRLSAPLDDPKIAEFVSQLEPINALADKALGFVWRLQSESGNATDLAYNEDPFVIVNMSVWGSIETLREFAYKSSHREVFRDRAKWFEKAVKPGYCLWWIPSGHIPTVSYCGFLTIGVLRESHHRLPCRRVGRSRGTLRLRHRGSHLRGNHRAQSRPVRENCVPGLGNGVHNNQGVHRIRDGRRNSAAHNSRGTRDPLR